MVKVITMLLGSNQMRHCQNEENHISFMKSEKSQPVLLQHQGFLVLMLFLFPSLSSIRASLQLHKEESV